MSKYKQLSKEEFMKEYRGEVEKEISISTGVKKIDELTGGIQKGKLTSILGWTGCGKSTWAINIAYLAQNQGLNVVYLSLEMSKYTIIANLLSRHSNSNKYNKQLEHAIIKKRKLSINEEKYLEDIIFPDYDNLPRKDVCIR